jgi:hypothetical protein
MPAANEVAEPNLGRVASQHDNHRPTTLNRILTIILGKQHDKARSAIPFKSIQELTSRQIFRSIMQSWVQVEIVASLKQ